VSTARVRAHVTPCGISGELSGTGTGFSPSTSFFTCQYYPANAPYSFQYSKLLFAEGQTGEAWGPSNKSDILSEIGEVQESKALFFFLIDLFSLTIKM
jgi:hypothetical protein